MRDIAEDIRACRLCTDRFAATATAHRPRPVPWFDADARILIAGQAPGARVHQSGRPFSDPSGDRLRDWLGLSAAQFYDRSKVAVLPIAFCFPGYDSRGADLPPPHICAKTWHRDALSQMPGVKLRILIGSYALRWHLSEKRRMTDVVRDWRNLPPDVFALPHPSWRNTAWLNKNPWFEAEVLPRLRAAVQREYSRDAACDRT